jgi:type I restriction enzyme S subunit
MKDRVIPDGYKLTEVGVIPCDWEVKRLGDVADVKTGPFGSTLHESDYVEDGTPIITVEHLGDMGVEYVNLPMVSKEDTKRLKAYSLRIGDIVFSRVGSVDRNALIREREDGWLFSGRLLRVRTKNTKDEPHYLSYHFHSEPFKQRVREVAVGQTMPSLNTQLLKGVQIVLPDGQEQRAIAIALSKMDMLLVKLDKLITKKRYLKQGAMQQLLTGKTRLPGFTGDWEVRRLGEVAYITKLAGFEYTKYFNSYKNKGDIIIIRGININENKLNLSDIKTIPYEVSNKLPRSQLKLNDLVFAYVGTIGPVYLIEQDNKYHLGPNTAKITALTNKILPIFIFIYFTTNMIKNEIIEQTSIGAQPSLSMGKIRRFKITFPPLPEQKEIAQILTKMDEEIEALEKKRDKYLWG